LLAAPEARFDASGGIGAKMHRALVALLLFGGLSACIPAGMPSASGPPAALGVPVPAAAPLASGRLDPRDAVQNFVSVLDQVEPIAEAVCRDRTRGVNCDFLIAVDDRPGQPPNAFQTLDRRGRPVLGFTVALIAEARSQDEIAFVLGHEASHHILGHIPQTQQTAAAGAMVAGILATASGADAAAIRSAQQMGAELGARSYAKEFELEADALGAEIAIFAGFDPVLGAGFFDRLPDPGDRFLSTHPPDSQRKAIVAEVAARYGR
jgi:Zn-dependent protease with chaperone function